VGDFNERKRKKVLEPFETALDAWCGSRKKEDDPTDKRCDRKECGYQLGYPSAEEMDGLLNALSSLEDFMRSEHDGSNAQRKEIIDPPIGDQRSEDRGGGQDRREKEKNDCLKDAKPSGYLAEKPRNLR